MGAVVVDASAFVACVLPDESAPDAIMHALRDAEFTVPALWPTEVGNTLLMAERRGRIGPDVIVRILNELRKRPLVIDPPGLDVSCGAVLEAARRYGLTAYDAAYLELAQRRRLPLATLDNELRKAARRARVKLV